MMIIIHKGRVVVVLASRNTTRPRAEFPTLENVVIVSTKEAILSQGKFIARN